MRRVLFAALLLQVGCADRVLPRTAPIPLPGREDVAATVFLIGDAGSPARRGEPVLQALRQLLEAAPDSSVVLFLGDNVYPVGLPDSAAHSFPEAARRLRAQLAVSEARPERLIFVPGNHDWQKSGPDGWNAIRREGGFVRRAGARMLPADGCPGPDVVTVAGVLRLVLLDTEWWLFPHQKPGAESTCPYRTEGEVEQALAAALDSGPAIVAAHHPLATGGEHGGYFSLTEHLFPLRAVHPALFIPLPIVGSIYPVARGLGVSDEDLSGGRNQRMRAVFERVFSCRPPVLYASGHEHTLQLIDRGRAPLLAVSGAGIYGHTSFVMGIPGTRLALSQAGFMRVDALRDGRLRLGVVTVDLEGRPHEVHSELLPYPSTERREPCDTLH
jgi:Calcineurin-like phosphoesterase